MIFLSLLLSLTCLFSTTKTKQFQLDDYVQMIYHQPAAYQHLLAAYQHPVAATAVAPTNNRFLVQPVYDYSYPVFKPQTLARIHRNVHHQINAPESKLLNLKLEGAESSLPLNSMMRNINQQLLLAENYNNQPTVATSAIGSLGAGLDDPSLVAANLIDSLDTDDPIGGHLDQQHLPYRIRDHGERQFTVSAINNNNSLALYRLLNLIDQSVPTIPMPFQNSKTSPPISVGGASPAGAYSKSNSNIVNSRSNISTYHQLHQNRHHPLASQSTSTSIPNYLNNWSRKRNQIYWRQQQQIEANNAKQQQLVDNANSIEIQPAALKMIKTSSYPTSPSSSTSRRNNNNHNNGSSSSSNSNSNGTNNDDIGFGNKQSSVSERLNGALTSSTLSNSKVPHDADSEIIGANNAPRCDKFTPDICVDDFEYPEQAIIDEIQKKRDVFELMYSEVKDNEPLVDGIPRDVEESYNYDYYHYGKSNLSQAASHISAMQIGAGLRLPPLSVPTTFKNHRLPTDESGGNGGSVEVAGLLDGSLSTIRARSVASIRDTINSGSDFGANLTITSANTPLGSSIDGMDALIGAITPHASPSSSSASAQSPPTTGFICPSEVMYGKPKLAKNKKGLWKVIVNAGEFTQTVRLEKCLMPNKRCNYVSAASYETRCAQVHSYHRLLVFEKGRGFYIDTFRLPTGCNCHVTRRNISRIVSASGLGGRVSQLSDSQDDEAPPPSQSGAFGGRNNGAEHELGQNQSHTALPGSRLSDPYARKKVSSESMLSQTLWSILSGSGGGGSSNSGHNAAYSPLQNSNNNNNQHDDGPSEVLDRNAYHASSSNTVSDDMSPAQREAYQSQSAILEHLSQNPSLAANISDSVLRQLIDVGQISRISAPQQPTVAPPTLAPPIHNQGYSQPAYRFHTQLPGHYQPERAPPPPPLPLQSLHQFHGSQSTNAGYSHESQRFSPSSSQSNPPTDHPYASPMYYSSPHRESPVHQPPMVQQRHEHHSHGHGHSHDHNHSQHHRLD